MSIPTNIKTELANLKAQVTAATPLSAASRPTIQAMQLNAGNLITDIDGAVITATGGLDNWVAPVDVGAIIAGINSVAQNAYDQRDLSSVRGVVGRAASNLDQLP